MKKLLATLLCLTGLTFAEAQNGPETQAQTDIKALINQIKRDTGYLYGEATMQTKDEATALAKDFLNTYIEQWVSEQPDPDKIRSVVATKVVSECEELTLMRGNMYRAFIYVKKSDLIALDRSSAIFEHPDQAAAETPEATEAQPVTATPPIQEKIESEPLPKAEQSETTPLAPEQEPLQATPSAPQAAEPEDSVVSPAVTEQEATAELFGGIPTDDLLRARYLPEMEAILARPSSECRYGIVGKTTTAASLEKALLVIFRPSDKRIEAVLGPKKPDRINLQTGAPDGTTNYPGCSAMWITAE